MSFASSFRKAESDFTVALPLELSELIFRHLPLDQLMNVAQVSDRWGAIAMSRGVVDHALRFRRAPSTTPGVITFYAPRDHSINKLKDFEYFGVRQSDGSKELFICAPAGAVGWFNLVPALNPGHRRVPVATEMCEAQKIRRQRRRERVIELQARIDRLRAGEDGDLRSVRSRDSYDSDPSSSDDDDCLSDTESESLWSRVTRLAPRGDKKFLANELEVRISNAVRARTDRLDLEHAFTLIEHYPRIMMQTTTN